VLKTNVPMSNAQQHNFKDNLAVDCSHEMVHCRLYWLRRCSFF